MTEPLKRALHALREESATCAAVLRDGTLITAHEKGVKPLMAWIAEGGDLLLGAAVADRVVGRAAALLMLHAGVREVYTEVISRHAAAVFERAKLPCTYGEQVSYIVNRRGDGMCPMEEACLEIDSPEEAYAVLLQKTADLR